MSLFVITADSLGYYVERHDREGERPVVYGPDLCIITTMREAAALTCIERGQPEIAEEIRSIPPKRVN